MRGIVLNTRIRNHWHGAEARAKRIKALCHRALAQQAAMALLKLYLNMLEGRLTILASRLFKPNRVLGSLVWLTLASYPESPNAPLKWMSTSCPFSSKDPYKRVLGPKLYDIKGIWPLKPYHLGPWALRALGLACKNER